MTEMAAYGIRINSGREVVAVNLPIEEVVKREIDPWWVDTFLDLGDPKTERPVVLPEYGDLQFRRLDNISIALVERSGSSIATIGTVVNGQPACIQGPAEKIRDGWKLAGTSVQLST